MSEEKKVFISQIINTPMDMLGKPSLNKIVFASGKLSAIICGLAVPIQWLVLDIRPFSLPMGLEVCLLVLYFIGLLIILASTINLGESLRVGLPKEKTSLKISGLYKISRNPIYLGAYIVIISSIVFTLNPIVFILGIYAMIVHHLIILSEEKFLMKRFGKSYAAYANKVRRYF